MSFVLGANYPWLRCGHDFGPRPPAWAGAGPTDWAQVRRDFEALSDLGLSVVRFWLLAGGVNYPVGRNPFAIAARVPFVDRLSRRSPWHDAERLEPRAEPPPLPSAFLDDFARLLTICRETGVRLLPSLLSFELFFPLVAQPGGPVSGGRSAFVLGNNQSLFFDRVLEPLLDLGVAHQDALFAFEVMNEPDWPVLGLDERGPTTPALALSRFLADGATRIARRGLLGTIGFCHAHPTWLTAEASATLTQLATEGAYLHQRHFYPREDLGMRLAQADASITSPCLLGELPSAQSGRWADPELWSTESDPERYLEARIALAQERGYAGALIWGCRSEDPHSRWDARVRAQLRRAARNTSSAAQRSS